MSLRTPSSTAALHAQPGRPAGRGGPGIAVGLGCLLAGVPLAAWGLAGGGLLAALAGLALVLVFVYTLMQWLAGAGKPAAPIKPAANSAWDEFNTPPPAGGGADSRKDGQ